MRKIVETTVDGTIVERCALVIDITDSKYNFDTYVYCDAENALETALNLYRTMYRFNNDIIVKLEVNNWLCLYYTNRTCIKFENGVRTVEPVELD